MKEFIKMTLILGAFAVSILAAHISSRTSKNLVKLELDTIDRRMELRDQIEELNELVIELSRSLAIASECHILKDHQLGKKVFRYVVVDNKPIKIIGKASDIRYFRPYTTYRGNLKPGFCRVYIELSSNSDYNLVKENLDYDGAFPKHRVVIFDHSHRSNHKWELVK